MQPTGVATEATLLFCAATLISVRVLASFPLAPALKASVPGEPPVSEKIQVKVWLCAPAMVTGAAVVVVPTITPPVTTAIGGDGTGVTPTASASPVLLTRRLRVKPVPRSTAAGSVKLKIDSCAGD